MLVLRGGKRKRKKRYYNIYVDVVNYLFVRLFGNFYIWRGKKENRRQNIMYRWMCIYDLFVLLFGVLCMVKRPKEKKTPSPVCATVWRPNWMETEKKRNYMHRWVYICIWGGFG